MERVSIRWEKKPRVTNISLKEIHLLYAWHSYLLEKYILSLLRKGNIIRFRYFYIKTKTYCLYIHVRNHFLMQFMMKFWKINEEIKKILVKDGVARGYIGTKCDQIRLEFPPKLDLNIALNVRCTGRNRG